MGFCTNIVLIVSKATIMTACRCGKLKGVMITSPKEPEICNDCKTPISFRIEYCQEDVQVKTPGLTLTCEKCGKQTIDPKIQYETSDLETNGPSDWSVNVGISAKCSHCGHDSTVNSESVD